MGFFSSVWKSVTKPFRSTVKAVSKVFGGGGGGGGDKVEIASAAPPLQDFLGNPGSEEIEKESAIPKKRKRGKKALQIGVNDDNSSGKTGLNI